MTSEKILRCCANKPSFEISYDLGSRYFVCEECFTKIPHWSRGITEKKKLWEG